MKLFINQTASRCFKVFLILTVGLPILVFLVYIALFKLGVAGAAEEMAGLLLITFFICFTPINFLFGDNIMPVDSLGPEPGVLGVIVSILFYVVVSFILGTVIGFVLEKGDASQSSHVD